VDELNRQFQVRDRLRREFAARSTMSQRLRDMDRLQQLTWEILRASPSGYEHFLRRNFKARAIPPRDSHVI
jgi:hypothetical protein